MESRLKIFVPLWLLFSPLIFFFSITSFAQEDLYFGNLKIDSADHRLVDKGIIAVNIVFGGGNLVDDHEGFVFELVRKRDEKQDKVPPLMIGYLKELPEKNAYGQFSIDIIIDIETARKYDQLKIYDKERHLIYAYDVPAFVVEFGQKWDAEGQANFRIIACKDIRLTKIIGMKGLEVMPISGDGVSLVNGNTFLVSLAKTGLLTAENIRVEVTYYDNQLKKGRTYIVDLPITSLNGLSGDQVGNVEYLARVVPKSLSGDQVDNNDEVEGYWSYVTWRNSFFAVATGASLFLVYRFFKGLRAARRIDDGFGGGGWGAAPGGGGPGFKPGGGGGGFSGSDIRTKPFSGSSTPSTRVGLGGGFGLVDSTSQLTFRELRSRKQANGGSPPTRPDGLLDTWDSPSRPTKSMQAPPPLPQVELVEENSSVDTDQSLAAVEQSRWGNARMHDLDVRVRVSEASQVPQVPQDHGDPLTEREINGLRHRQSSLSVVTRFAGRNELQHGGLLTPVVRMLVVPDGEKLDDNGEDQHQARIPVTTVEENQHLVRRAADEEGDDFELLLNSRREGGISGGAGESRTSFDSCFDNLQSLSRSIQGRSQPGHEVDE